MSNIKLTIIRYIAMSGFIASLVIEKNGNFSFFIVLLVLMFLLNNQMRYYVLQRKKWYMLFSVIVELGIIYSIIKYHGGIIFFGYFVAAFDSAFIVKPKLSYVALAFTLVVTEESLRLSCTGFSESASTLAAFAILFFLADHIREEHERKLEAQELYDKLRVSEEKLIKANNDLESYASSVEELTLLRERNRISREIHDSVGHSLSTIIIQLGAIEKIAGINGSEASKMSASLCEFAKDSLREVREAVRQLKPKDFEEIEELLAIEELIKNFQKFTGVEIKFGFSKERWKLSADKSLVVYRAVQEFLSNAVRHGKASKVSIYMNFVKESLIITMQDNGMGAGSIKEGVGLKSISERARENGGSMSYSSEAGKGFFLKLLLYKADKIFMDKE